MSSDTPALKGIQNVINKRLMEIERKSAALRTEKSQLEAMLEAAKPIGPLRWGTLSTAIKGDSHGGLKTHKRISVRRPRRATAQKAKR